jgi:hypothetical protein
MQPDAASAWPDWVSSLRRDETATERSMRNLARYANPEMLAMLGISAGRVSPGNTTVLTSHDEDNGKGSWSGRIARRLTMQLQGARGVGYSVEPFRPAGPRGQIIRTTSELLEGQGTCVDFAVTVAAGCVREQAPVYLCMMTADDLRADHAFLAVPPLGDPRSSHGRDDPRSNWLTYDLPAFRSVGFDEFIDRVLGSDRCEVVDPTPPQPGAGSRTPVEVLEEHRATGRVYMVLVQGAVTGENPFHQPGRPRSLGITALLPDLPAEIRDFPSRVTTLSRLGEARGTVVILGETGVGKSTLALIRAHAAASSRGWFLDASDRQSLRTSFAAAEAQCTGRRLDNVQKENLDSLSAFARRRLAATNRPWVVVLDNADSEPKQVADLVPLPGHEQLVIITSANPQWADYATGAGWGVIPVGLLNRADDLSAAEQELPLPQALLRPGLVRLGLAAAAEGLNSSGGDIDVPLLLQSLFGDPAGFAARLPHDPVAACLVAAAIMPPEEVRQEWLAACLARPTEAPEAIERLVDLGVLETSRRIRDVRTPERRTFWLHRLIRAAVLDTYVDVAEPEVVRLICRVLSVQPTLTPGVARSREDLNTLSALLRQAAITSADPSLPAAILTVLDSLEPLGGSAVKQAATLAEAVLHVFPDRDDADWRQRSTPMVAMARRVVQDKNATPDDVTGALAVCQELTARLVADQSRDGSLVRGRTDAVRALLLRKRASALLASGDESAALGMHEEVIKVLTESFSERATALGWKPPSRRQEPGPRPEVDDPNRHIDRAWYNLGGAYNSLAKVALGWPRSEARMAMLVKQWSDGLWGYAGSLWLRPDDDMYRAASLWGVALVLYMAALNGAFPVDLTGIPRSEAIDGLWGRQDRDVLLRVAEECATRAHAIRADIAGPFDADTAKTRELVLKVSAAWPIPEPTTEYVDAAVAFIAGFLYEDLGLEQPKAPGQSV